LFVSEEFYFKHIFKTLFLISVHLLLRNFSQSSSLLDVWVGKLSSCCCLRMSISLIPINSVRRRLNILAMSQVKVTLVRLRRARSAHGRLPRRAILSLSVRLHWLLSFLALASHPVSISLSRLKLLILLAVTRGVLSVVWMAYALPHVVLVLHLLHPFLGFDCSSVFLHSGLVCELVKFISGILGFLSDLAERSFRTCWWLARSFNVEWFNGFVFSCSLINLSL